MKKKFRIRLCSDLDYEEMVADVCYMNDTLGIINQDKGVDAMEIRIYHPNDLNASWQLPLDELIETLQLAKKNLKESEKIESD